MAALDLFDLVGRIRVDTNSYSQALERAEEQAKKAEKRLQDIGSSMSEAGSKMTIGITAPIAGVALAAIQSASSVEEAMANIKNATGVTVEEAEKLTESARNIYKKGYGESLDDVSAALIRVKQNMQQLKGEELEEATRNAMLLAKTFDADINEVTRGAQSLMTAFGANSEQVFNKLASSTNLNFTDDLFDQMAEFASVAQRYGYTMDEYFDLMQRGSQAGVYNMDRINNSVLEFGLRAEDGSKGTTEAFAQLSKSTQSLWNDMLAGKATSAELSSAVIAELKAMDDQVAADQIGIGLWGTVWEDNTQQVMYSMYDVNAAIKGTSQTIDDLAKTSEETFGQKWQSFLRTAQSSLEPVGMILIDLASEWLPKVAGWIEKVATSFKNLSPRVQESIVLFGGVAAALGPILMVLGPIISSIGSIIGVFGQLSGTVGKVLPVLGRFIPMLLRFIPGVGLVITALSLITSVFKVFGGDILDGLIQGLSEKKDAVLNKILEIGSSIKDFFKSLFGIASPSTIFNEYGQWIMQGLINGISSLVGNVISLFSGLFKNLTSKASTGVANIHTKVSAGFNQIVGSARNMASNVTIAVSNTFSNAASAASSFATKAVGLGSDIASGIANGINSGKQWVSNAVTSLSEKALGVFKKDNKIQSPSKLYENEASWIPAGIAGGIDKGQSNVSQAMKNLVNATKERFKATLNIETATNFEMLPDKLRSFSPDQVKMPSLQNMYANIKHIPERLNQLSAPYIAPVSNTATGIGQGSFNVQDMKITIQVQQVSDLSSQQIQNLVTNRFFDKARSKE